MSAARLLKEARAAGLSLRISPAGKLACRGPAETLERLKPALAERRDELIEELRSEVAVAYDPAAFSAKPIGAMPRQCAITRPTASAAAAISRHSHGSAMTAALCGYAPSVCRQGGAHDDDASAELSG